MASCLKSDKNVKYVFSNTGCNNVQDDCLQMSKNCRRRDAILNILTEWLCGQQDNGKTQIPSLCGKKQLTIPISATRLWATPTGLRVNRTISGIPRTVSTSGENLVGRGTTKSAAKNSASSARTAEFQISVELTETKT